MTSPTLHDTPHSNTYNVQPLSDTPKSRIFPTLSYSKDNRQVFTSTFLILPILYMKHCVTH